MQFDATTILVVGGDLSVHAVIQDAAARAFRDARVLVARNAAEPPLLADIPSVDLLVLVDAGKLDVEKILRWPIPRLRQCPVVRLGANDADGADEVVGPEEWNAPLLARTFRFAVKKGALARERDRALGDLLTIGRRISHDFRTPLGGILTSVELLRELSVEEKPAPAELVQPIAESAQELVKIIDRVGFLAKASGAPLAKSAVSMAEPVYIGLGKWERRIGERQITVSQPAEWPTVSGVVSWLGTVWWNLIGNALQHAGNITRIELGWESLEDEYRFWVADDGDGIPVERRGRLFQPFHTLHELGSSRGIGLSISQRLIELQNGRCGYEPRPAGGSTFFFILPKG